LGPVAPHQDPEAGPAQESSGLAFPAIAEPAIPEGSDDRVHREAVSWFDPTDSMLLPDAQRSFDRPGLVAQHPGGPRRPGQAVGSARTGGISSPREVLVRPGGRIVQLRMVDGPR